MSHWWRATEKAGWGRRTSKGNSTSKNGTKDSVGHGMVDRKCRVRQYENLPPYGGGYGSPRAKGVVSRCDLLRGATRPLLRGYHCTSRPSRDALGTRRNKVASQSTAINVTGVKREQNVLSVFLTPYGPNSCFSRFSRHNLRQARFFYRLIGATLIGNLFDDPFLNWN